MRWTHALPAVLLLAGCGDGRRAAPRVTRDSAGVEIIENSRPAWGDSAGWRVAASPVLDLGVASGDAHVEFQSILGLTRLDNGNIVVANRGTRELRLFAPSGEHIRSIGRDGEGPGEFRSLFGVYRYGADSLIAWDNRLNRWSVFDSAGRFAHSGLPARPVMNPRLLEPLVDGSLLIADTWIDGSPDNPRIDHLKILRSSPDGRHLDSLGTYRSWETFGSTDGMPIRMGRTFGPRPVIASVADGYLIGPAEEYEVLQYDSAGRLVRRIRWQGEDRTVTGADVDAFRARFREQQDVDTELGAAFIRLVDEVPAADRFPAYSMLVVDTDGNLWLAAYPRPLREGPRLWTVIDAAGRWLGEVALPEGLEVWDIGGEYVLGVMDDDLGVEHVQSYRLIKEE